MTRYNLEVLLSLKKERLPEQKRPLLLLHLQVIQVLLQSHGQGVVPGDLPHLRQLEDQGAEELESRER